MRGGGGCVTPKCKPTTQTVDKDCPPEDIVYLAETPIGPQFFPMKKGFLSKRYKGQHWMTKEEWEKIIKTREKWIEEYEEKYEKHKGEKI